MDNQEITLEKLERLFKNSDLDVELFFHTVNECFSELFEDD